jgi:hypothetical protein
MAATYASIVTASEAMEDSSLNDKVAESDKVEDDGSAPATTGGGSPTPTDTDYPDVQIETLASPNTGAQSATQDGSDDVTDTAQCITELERCQIMENNETQGVSPTSHDVESNIFSIKSRGNSPIRNKKEAAATYVVSDVEMAQKDDTTPHKDRDRTPEENRRSPKRNIKLKMDKFGERSQSLPRKASHKSVKM